MLNGVCPYRNILKEPYIGPQLAAAVAFLQAHRGQVNPVSLSIGGNDVLPASLTCDIPPGAENALDEMDARLTAPNSGILPRLAAALTATPTRRVMSASTPGSAIRSTATSTPHRRATGGSRRLWAASLAIR